MASHDMHDAPLEERVAIEQAIWDRERVIRTFADPSMLQLTYPSYEGFFGSYPEYRYVMDFFGPSVVGKRILEVGCGRGGRERRAGAVRRPGDGRSTSRRAGSV
jgi:hypothetical protein